MRSSAIWIAALYRIKKCFEDTEIPYDDGLHIVYVNAAVDDGSPIAAMMQYFKTSNPDNMEHGELSKWVHYLKRAEGGFSEMCEVSEKIFNEGKAEGRIENQKKTALNLSKMGIPAEKIAEIIDASVKLVQEWISGGGTPSTAK